MNDRDSGRVGPAQPFAIVAIAASAGGITALSHVLGGLPNGFPVPVVIVQHLDPRHKTVIAEVLGRRTKMPVRLAQEGDRVQAGTIYIAPRPSPSGTRRRQPWHRNPCGRCTPG